MSQINQAALSRVATSTMSGAGIAQLFVMLADAARLAPSGANVNFNLGFQQPGDKTSPGDLFPFITLTLAPSQITSLDGTDLSTNRGPAEGTTGEQPVS